MSRACAMSARNCFWIRNRRLPRLELPSIKNDKSTLQSEGVKKDPVTRRISHGVLRGATSALPVPEAPEMAMKRKRFISRVCPGVPASCIPVLGLISVTVLGFCVINALSDVRHGGALAGPRRSPQWIPACRCSPPRATSEASLMLTVTFQNHGQGSKGKDCSLKI